MRLSVMILTMLFVNVLLFLTQTSVDTINPDGSKFFDYSGSWIEAKDDGNFTLNEDVNLPESQSSVDVTDGNIFTDSWRTLTSWLNNKIPGLDFLGRVLNGPSSFLKAAGVAEEISFAVGFLWHVIGVFLFVTWIRGGST